MGLKSFFKKIVKEINRPIKQTKEAFNSLLGKNASGPSQEELDAAAAAEAAAKQAEADAMEAEMRQKKLARSKELKAMSSAGRRGRQSLISGSAGGAGFFDEYFQK